MVEIESNSSHPVFAADSNAIRFSRTRIVSRFKELGLERSTDASPRALVDSPPSQHFLRLPRWSATLFSPCPFPGFHSLSSLSCLPTTCVRWRTRSNKLAAIALMNLFQSMFWIPARTQRPSSILAIRPPKIASGSPRLDSRRRRRPRACRNQGQCRQRHHTQTSRYVTHPSQDKIRGEKRILGKHRNEPFSSCRIWGHDHSYKADCRLTHGSKWCDFRA